MSLVRLILNSNGSTADFKSQCNLSVLGLDGINNFQSYLAGLVGGMQAGASFAFEVGAVKATATIAFASTGPVNDQTCTLLGVTFTAKTSASTSVQFTRSNTPSVNAVNLAAKINAYSDFSGVVTASVSSATITVSAVVPGLMGNLLAPLANADLANTTIVSWAGGLDGTSYSIDLR